MSERNYNIDILKAIAIVFVILLHSLPENIKALTGAPYHLWQAVPVFMILTGYNFANSYEKEHYESLNQMYKFSFLRKRFERILFPVIGVFGVQVLLRYYSGSDFDLLKPFSWMGPGSYYIPVMLQAILIFPIIYFLCKRNLLVMPLVLFGINLSMEFLCLLLNVHEELYRLLIVRYIFALTLGAYLSLSKLKIQNSMLLILLTISSLVYITGVHYFDWNFIMEKFWLAQHAPSYFWPFFLVINGLVNYKATTKTLIMRVGIQIGKASYHIFLVQMTYFWTIVRIFENLPNALRPLINVFICLIFGILFFELEKYVRKKYHTFRAIRGLESAKL